VQTNPYLTNAAAPPLVVRSTVCNSRLCDFSAHRYLTKLSKPLNGDAGVLDS
jgi:hypothetical protein